MGKLMCPHCGNTRLFGMVKTSAEFEIERENGEDKTNELKVSSNPNNRTYEIMFCGKCKAPLTYEELTEGFICKECGTASPEVNEEGLCLLCQAKKDRKELFSLTKEELLRRFLSLEKEISRTDPKVAKGLEKVQEMKAQDTADDQTEAEAPVETQEEAKPEKKRKVKKKVDAPVDEENAPAKEEEQVQHTEATEEPVTDDPFAILGSGDTENAPFPDMDLPSSSDIANTEQNNSGDTAGDGVGMLGHGQSAMSAYTDDDDDRF